MIEYYHVGGQLYAHFVKQLGTRIIWYVSWCDGVVRVLHPHGRRLIPDDIQ